ncbi:MAG: RDD family protein, partial [Candidatus Bathyarchaeia archaeon]
LLIIYLIVGLAMFGSVNWQVTGAAATPVIMVNGLINFLYFAILEGTMGATLGKKVLKIKVVKDDGSPCSIGASVIRNILRIIDVLPFIYIVGMILITRSPKKQRLGDRIAHTVVVGAAPIVTTTDTPSPTTVELTPGEMSFCINCGAKIHQAATFCPKCGAKQ